jgi:glutathione S-transferase
MTIEIREGRGVGPNKDHIHLHLDHLDPKILHERLPGISESAKIFAGVDVTKEPIPVLPTVHYNMGGIPTNYHGEVLTKVGRRSGYDRAGPDGRGRSGLRVGARRQPPRLQLADRPCRVRPRRRPALRREARSQRQPARPAERRQAMITSPLRQVSATPRAAPHREAARHHAAAMQEDCAVFRTGETLESGVKRMAEVSAAWPTSAITDRGLIWNTDLIETLEFDNLIVQAAVTVNSAPTAPKAAAPTPAKTSRARRQELDEAHPGLDRRQGRRHDRLPPGAHLHDVQRRRVHQAEGAGLLGFLAEKGASLPLVEVSIMTGDIKKPDHLARDPLGQLPTLELDDGTFLSETVAICRYLESLHPSPPMFGRNALETARIDMLTRRVEFQIGTPAGMFWRHAHPFTARVVVPQYTEFGESNRAHYERGLAWIDRELAGRDFVAGADYTIADICLLSMVDFADWIGLKVPENLANLRAWHARVSERPSAKA